MWNQGGKWESAEHQNLKNQIDNNNQENGILRDHPMMEENFIPRLGKYRYHLWHKQWVQEKHHCQG